MSRQVGQERKDEKVRKDSHRLWREKGMCGLPESRKHEATEGWAALGVCSEWTIGLY
jgi:hypothetical protein